jgi:UDP-3-O-[3-hydroxymyristoyl] glucosamine N-acyltransferase
MKQSFTEEERLQYARTTSSIYPPNEIHESVKHGPIALGEDGFGWVRDETKKPVRIPHRGNIIIEKDVEFGSYCSIDRAAVGSTVVMEGTKIGHHVHVGHGATIGRHCLIVDRVGIGGSCEIGDFVYIGHGATIRNKVVIGDGAFIGQHANVICDVPAGETWIGNPARKLEKRK